ncbi:MAG: hypothetical protein A2269_03050, partial [Lentisphaerae bacterium RIFOXYA12_FULL_60_10]
PDAVQPADLERLHYINPKSGKFHLLDKILSFDDLQDQALIQAPPLILIGSAGSGKTVLTLAKLRQFSGDILYVTHSPFLVENARSLYYGHHYENDGQNVEFLSFREYLETIAVPPGKPMDYTAFADWFRRHCHGGPIRDSHRLFEEFNGVITGASIDRPHLSRDDYLSLGVRRSIFTGEERPAVYDLFVRYLAVLKSTGYYDLNLICHGHLPRCQPAYDWIVADEVQDLTAVQLALILKSLRHPTRFVLCGDSNQIVHPNFFSWAAVKTLFYEERLSGHGEIIRVLNANYRNSPEITRLANRLLLIKHTRFGSIDRESNYLVRSVADKPGTIELLEDTPRTKQELNRRTNRSTRFAVMVLRPEDKPAARAFFQTPLIFSVQDAKGLEYENVILLDFVSGHPAEFQEITRDVTPDDLQRNELAYARNKDKTDKSLEAYKFFINALYVAATRSIRNLYLIESQTHHRLFHLLDLHVEKREIRVADQTSSLDEWKAEANKLEQQGKRDQADEIRRVILGTQTVPWRVLTTATYPDLLKEALDPNRFNRQAKLLLFDYALAYSLRHIFRQLRELGFNPAHTPEVHRANEEAKYTRDYHEKGWSSLRRKINQYGVNFRNPLNQTPLMLAARLGQIDLVKQLIADGADPRARDNTGLIAFQMALREAYENPSFARDKFAPVYETLAPSSLRLRVHGRLVKLDRHQMEFFLVHSMFARFEAVLGKAERFREPLFQTGDFVAPLQHFPEPVIPERRRVRAYLSSVLARNEIAGNYSANRKLFVRIRTGKYVLNPCIEIETNEDQWSPVYDALCLAGHGREEHDPNVKHFMENIRHLKTDIESSFIAKTDSGFSQDAIQEIKPIP